MIDDACSKTDAKRNNFKCSEKTNFERIEFAEVLEINKDEILSCDAAVLSEMDDVVVGQDLSFLQNDTWQIGTVSRVLDTKICVFSVDENIKEFRWIQRDEFGERLRFAFKGEEGLLEHVFALGISEAGDEGDVVPKSREFVFAEAKDVSIPLNCLISKDSHSCTLHLFCRPNTRFKEDAVMAEWEFQLITSLEHKMRFPSGPQYIIKQSEPLLIDKSVDLQSFSEQYGIGGSLQVASASKIVVGNDAVIQGKGRGLTATTNPQIKMNLKFGALHAKCQTEIEENMENIRCPKDHKMRPTIVYRSKEDFICTDCSKKQRTGSDVFSCDHSACKFRLCVKCFDDKVIPEEYPGAGGGVVSFISCGGVTNNGSIECPAANSKFYSGGAVMIHSEGRFESNGVIDCGDDGEVFVECTEFVNNGSIQPAPNVVIGNWKDSMMMPWIRAMTSKHIEESIKLIVKKWRGHRYNNDQYHPRNLLVKKTESENGYSSGYGESGSTYEDWITFGVVEKARFIPTKIFIRNGNLKRVAICGGTNTAEFDDWIRIDRIRNDNSVVQMFPIDVASSYAAWHNQYSYFNLLMKQNWGGGYNSFLEVDLFGIILDQ